MKNIKVKKVLRLKNESFVVTYVQMLQSNISRMSNHSGIIKASICVIYTILITVLIALQKVSDYWWFAITITLISAFLDSYYLAIEKIYIKKYDDFIFKLNNGCIDEYLLYDMKPRNTNNKCELLATIICSLLSFSIIGFYSLLIIISVFIKFI